jgi:cob(I)alamin adenosyltransferase
MSVFYISSIKAFQDLGFWFGHHLYTLILKAFPDLLADIYYFFSLIPGVIPLNPQNTRKVYTGKGDLGQCSQLSGERIMKYADHVEAGGDVDELSSVLGLLVSVLPQRASWLSTEIEQIQESLFQIGALISADLNSPLLRKLKPVSWKQVRSLEQSIDFMDQQLPELKRFIIPGGHISAAQANVGRSVCRRAERHVVKSIKNYNLKELPEVLKNVPAYLNRLSDYLFVVGRYCNFLTNSIEQENSLRTFSGRQITSSLIGSNMSVISRHSLGGQETKAS